MAVFQEQLATPAAAPGALLGPLFLLVVSTLAVASLSFEAPAHGRVAVLFPPWWSASRSLATAAAAGAVVALGGIHSVVIVEPDASDYTTRLRREGALLFLNPKVFAGCTSAPFGQEASHDR